MHAMHLAIDILTIYSVYIQSYLVAIVSYKYAQNPVKLFTNCKAIDSRTAPALYSYVLQSYNIAMRIYITIIYV